MSFRPGGRPDPDGRLRLVDPLALPDLVDPVGLVDPMGLVDPVGLFLPGRAVPGDLPDLRSRR